MFPIRVLELLKNRSGLCVGIDPSAEMLTSWGLKDNIIGLSQFSQIVTRACIKSQVGFVKPQIAFYERFGWEGLRILSEINLILREAGILVILDGKRGDIGSTASAYAEAYLSDSNYHKFDALTVNPFLGISSLTPFFDIIRQQQVGIFIVVRSSNFDSYWFQEAKTKEGLTVADWLAERIKEENDAIFGKQQFGAVGAVIGSTLDGVYPLLERMPTSFFLCPGIGAQGATFASAIKNLGKFSGQCIFPISRGLTLEIKNEGPLFSKICKVKEELQEAIQNSKSMI